MRFFMSELIIRAYKDSDYQKVFELHHLALADAGADAGYGPWDNDLLNIEEKYLNNGGDFVVALLGDKLIAMGGLQMVNKTTAEIRRMRVHPDYQRKGYGQLILNHLERAAIDLGYRTIVLDTSIALNAARSFYQKNGYIQTEIKKTGNESLVFYKKQLIY